MSQQRTPEQVILNRLVSGHATAEQWEDVTLLLKARAMVQPHFPQLRLPPNDHKTAQYSQYQGDDLFLLNFAKWFQTKMTWVNTPPCTFCANSDKSKMTPMGSRGPQTPEEISGQASRVEVYLCNLCNTQTTFPRYNSVSKILETLSGRCGEYANLMGLFCRALGFTDVRYVLDLTDHVWIEVYSHRLSRYIMVDGCEGQINVPQMYEKGWGKKLSVILAFQRNVGCVDVTQRYTRKLQTTEFQAQRRDCFGGALTADPNALLKAIHSFNGRFANYKKKNTATLARWQDEQGHFQHIQKNSGNGWGNDTHVEGRISGSLEWRLSRNETSTKKTADDKKESNKDTTYIASHHPPFLSSIKCLETICISVQHDERVSNGSCINVSGAVIPTTVNKLTIVIVDHVYGCLLQIVSVSDWKDAVVFLNSVPNDRIVILSNRLPTDETDDPVKEGNKATKPDDFVKSVAFPRIGGLVAATKTFIGQVNHFPQWATSSDSDCSLTVKITLNATCQNADLCLKHDTHNLPTAIYTRLHESIMPYQTQLLATLDQKRQVVTSQVLFNNDNTDTIGFVTKDKGPVYLLTNTCFPLQPKSRPQRAHRDTSDNYWHLEYLLPKLLVPPLHQYTPTEHNKHSSSNTTPQKGIITPVDINFFRNLLGTHLQSHTPSGTQSLQPIQEALSNKRFVALYFSAHWCPPCKKFTPLLSEFYTIIRDELPDTLELVFVSSDRDEHSFRQYWNTMPFLACPFDDAMRKQMISARFGIQGIPALVVLDSISGTVISDSNMARNQVSEACRWGSSDAMERLVQETWLQSPLMPAESIAIMESLALSLEKGEELPNDDENDPLRDYLVRKDIGVEKEAHRNTSANVNITDTATRVRQLFNEFVKNGETPTQAAAMAIQATAKEEQDRAIALQEQNQSNDHSQNTTDSKLDAGTLDTHPWIVFKKCPAVSLVGSDTKKTKKEKNHLVSFNDWDFNGDYCSSSDDNKLDFQTPFMLKGLKLYSKNQKDVSNNIATADMSNNADTVAAITRNTVIGIQSIFDRGDGTIVEGPRNFLPQKGRNRDDHADFKIFEINVENGDNDSNSSITAVEVAMIKDGDNSYHCCGLQSLKLLYKPTSSMLTVETTTETTNHKDVSESPSMCRLDVPNGFQLIGFHGHMSAPLEEDVKNVHNYKSSSSGYAGGAIVSLGLIVCKKQNCTQSSSLTREERETKEPLFLSHIRSQSNIPENILKCASKLYHENDNNKEVVQQVILTLKKYLLNVMREPYNPLFRMMKLSNKICDRGVTQNPGGLDLFLSIGLKSFLAEGSDFLAAIPLAMDLERMNEILKDLLLLYENDENITNKKNIE